MLHYEKASFGTAYADGGNDISASCTECGETFTIHRTVEGDEELIADCKCGCNHIQHPHQE